MNNRELTLEDLAGMIKRRFDGIDKVLNDHTERLVRIETKLEGVVYRREFDELKGRVDELENLLAVNKKP